MKLLVHWLVHVYFTSMNGLSDYTVPSALSCGYVRRVLPIDSNKQP
jgi:hypothetical protein